MLSVTHRPIMKGIHVTHGLRTSDLRHIFVVVIVVDFVIDQLLFLLIIFIVCFFYSCS